jgi:intermembrane space import and assembly protein 40
VSIMTPRKMCAEWKATATEHSQPAKLSRPVEAPSEPISSTTIVEVDVFVPDAPSEPESTPAAAAETPSTEGEGETPPGEGETPSGEAAASGGAFNPVTGEINWDCPCLGGMAHGPCGPEFREAFSCFVFSEAEPKGINCVDKFQNMQNCFRAHPDVYADGAYVPCWRPDTID